jgi:hypothetical protein
VQGEEIVGTTLNRTTQSLTIATLLACAAQAFAGPGSPEVRSLLPTGGQRDQELTLTLTGERLQGASGLLFYGSGITLVAIENVDDKTVKARCQIAADCPLGEHLVRLRTNTGLSDVASVWIGALPTIAEAEPNSDLQHAQAVAINSTISGIITREDADYFAIEARKGQRLSVEIEAMRLGRGMFDPAVSIMDARRFELAVCDDSSLLGQDATLSAVAPADGTYYVMVRDAAYGGSDSSHYRLHIGEFPRPLLAWPPGGLPQQPVTLEWKGDPLGMQATRAIAALPESIDGPPEPAPAPVEQQPFVPPAQAEGLTPIFATDALGSAPSPNWFVTSSLPIAGDTTLEAPAAVPAAFHGVLAAAGENDRLFFSAKAGTALELKVLSRRLRSPADLAINIFDAKGGHLAGNDDASGADPEVRFTPGADGVYEARINEHRGRGGDAFIYRLEIAPPRPHLEMSLDRVDIRRPQFLQAVSVPKGGSFAAMLKVQRQDVGGDCTFAAADLPAGVTMTAQPIPGDLGAIPVLFEAAADAPLAGSLAQITGTIADKTGTFAQPLPLVISAPNETVYYQTRIERLAVAVTEPAPYRITLTPSTTPLLRSGMKQLTVTVERTEGFTGDVVVQMLWNPPGISSAGSITIPAAQTTGQYLLNATGDAPLKPWKLCVLAHANVQGGDLWTSSKLVDLAVADTLFGGAIQMAATEQGKTTGIVCKLTPTRAFEGKAKLSLLGLPAKTTCAPIEIDAAATEVVFEVKTEADTPVGQHKGLFCEIELAQGAESINHRFAFGGVLRVDAPAPPPKQVAAATPPPTPPPAAPAGAAPPPPPKPLSRLEQLRKQAAEQQGKTPETPK